MKKYFTVAILAQVRVLFVFFGDKHNLLTFVMIMLQRLGLFLLQLCGKTPLKTTNEKTINKKMFWDIIPLLDDYLKKRDPSPTMVQLKKFQLHFKNLSENQQLLFIMYMTTSYKSFFNQSDEICYVYSCVMESTFLQDWNRDMLVMDRMLSNQNRNECIIYRLRECFFKIDRNRRVDLMISLLQISECSVMEEIRTHYWSLGFGLLYDQNIVIRQNEEKDRIVSELLRTSSNVRHILLLHRQLEQMMILHLQQLRSQLNHQIEMEIELEIFLQ